jgi:glycine/D-amino acid oxidase-like deaminating enzyme
MRLTHPSIRPVGRSIAFSFDGQPIQALEGETIAASLSAAGMTALRKTASGAPRGLHCGMGACWDCLVTVDGRVGQRACMTQAADGLVVESGFPAEPADYPAADPRADVVCDVLVVGGGVAGLSAGAVAAGAGASVVLLDERHAPGGQFGKALAGSHRDDAPDRQFQLGLSLRAEAEAAGVRIESDALVWGAFAANEIAALVRGRAVVYRPRRLILATGAHEAPNPIPGWTLPGVMTTGGVQTLVRTQRVLPGKRVLIAGNGPLNLQLACELLAAGVTPVAVVEGADQPDVASLGSLLRMAWAAPDLLREGREMVATLRRAGVPVLWRSRLDRLEGDGRVQVAVVGKRRFEVDVVAMNVGFLPETGLARALGARHSFVDRGPVGFLRTETDEEGRTSVDRVFAVGDGAMLGGSRVAMARGRLAGGAAAAELGFAVAADEGSRAAVAEAVSFQEGLWKVFAAGSSDVADETIVCRCEEVTARRLREEMAAGLTSIAALKKATRAGMGRCQGRFCAATIARMCPGRADEESFAAPRAPLRPVPAAPLMKEAPEFLAPLLGDFVAPSVLHPLPPLAVEERRADVVVVGGGVAGLSTAYYLAREGADVLLIDRDEAAMAASTANAGSLHVQLLSYDFTDETPADGGPAGHTLPLAPRSIALWKEIGAAAGEDLGIRTEGGLMLAETQEGMEWLRRKSVLENRCGIESHVLSHNELRDLAPALSDRMIGADFVPAEGYGDPLRGMMALLKLSQAAGARVLRGAEVRAIERDGASWRVTTSKGVVTAGKVVNATGPWAGRTARMVGMELPVTGTVQQVIVTEPVAPLTRHLVALAHRHLSLKQQANGSFLVGGGWFGGFDPVSGRTRALRENIQGNLWVCERVLPALRAMTIVRAWTGINPSIDRAPIMGEAPGLPGFFNAVTANGYTLGPVVGAMTAAEVLRGDRVDGRYRVERFG